MSQNLKKHGFSLVELAIVLVIIGLITGGILTGQELIRSSEIQSISADINKYKTAINTFKLKYNALPGDLPNAYSYWNSCGTNAVSLWSNQAGCNGNGDGNISNQQWAGGNFEALRAWQHLSLSGLIPGSFSGVSSGGNSTTTEVIGTNVPESRIAGTCYHLQYWGSLTGNAYWFDGQYPNFIEIGSLNSNVCWYVFLTSTEAYALDSKVDDGLPGLGKWRTRTPTGNPNCATSATPSTATYNLSATGQNCSFNILLQ